MLMLTSGVVGSQVFADKCDKNHDNNCNHPDKNQNSNPKINCDIHIDAKDHLNDNNIGPTNQQCQNNSNNIKDSTVTQTPLNDNNQGQFTVKSTSPSDGDNNVPLDTDVKVTFSDSIDKNTIDTGSLTLFNLDQAIDPDVQDVSVSGKVATFTLRSTSGGQALLPNTDYEATISSSIKDQNGRSLDCSASSGVDSNCHWQFSTSGGSPSITLNPTSGPVLTQVAVTGTGFDPLSLVTINFDNTNLGTVTTTSSGEFSVTFIVPVSSSIGDHTVKASQGSNSASKTFKVTALANPIIFLDPTSGPEGTPVDITGAGFDPNSSVDIKFNGTTVTTTPTPVAPGSNGEFLANFTVPSSSIGVVQVVATQGSKSASQAFNVTSGTTSPAVTSRSSFEIPRSVASLVPTSPF
jgi:Bacterial Ig-like domain